MGGTETIMSRSVRIRATGVVRATVLTSRDAAGVITAHVCISLRCTLTSQLARPPANHQVSLELSESDISKLLLLYIYVQQYG